MKPTFDFPTHKDDDRTKQKKKPESIRGAKLIKARSFQTKSSQTLIDMLANLFSFFFPACILLTELE